MQNERHEEVRAREYHRRETAVHLAWSAGFDAGWDCRTEDIRKAAAKLLRDWRRLENELWAGAKALENTEFQREADVSCSRANQLGFDIKTFRAFCREHL